VTSIIVVDGSAGEGGGQVLRSSLTLSTITGQAVEIQNIRAGRAKPGLKPQHLTAVEAAAAICDASVTGARLDSQTIRFTPGGPAQAGNYSFDVAQVAGKGSAGAVGLVLQTVLLPLAMCQGDSQITLNGGTHVPWAPSAHYLQEVFLPAAGRMGVEARVELVEWGFYPAGGGEIGVMIRGRAGALLQPMDTTERGKLKRIWGLGVAANLPSHIPQRMANRARNLLAEEGLTAEMTAQRVKGAGPGAGVFLFAEYESASAGFTAYGRKGLPAEQVAQSACDELLEHHYGEAPVDPHLADQLILPMALSAGICQMVTSRITEHLITNLNVVNSFLPIKTHVAGRVGKPGSISLTRIAND
jgi:RNA 3'-terminal phosphate cyclase (ATP)